jgi:hypothetical protein
VITQTSRILLHISPGRPDISRRKGRDRRIYVRQDTGCLVKVGRIGPGRELVGWWTDLAAFPMDLAPDRSDISCGCKGSEICTCGTCKFIFSLSNS